MRSNSGVIRKTADTGLDGELVVCVGGVGGAWIEAVDSDGGKGGCCDCLKTDVAFELGEHSGVCDNLTICP